MDIFIEEMVERKRTAVQVAGVFGLMLVSVFFAYILMTLVLPLIPALASVVFLLTVGVFYFCYRVAVSFNVEYEYSLVGNEIDIDKIQNRKKRKRLTTVNIRNLENFGVCKNNAEYKKSIGDVSVKKIYACKDKQDDSNYFAVYFENSVKCMLIFSPSEKITEVIEKFNPKRV